MSTSQMSQPALFGDETAAIYGESETESAVRELIKEIKDQGRMTPALRIMCTTAMRLAKITEQTKSAIASVQAASQLTILIEKINGDDVTNADELPVELQTLMGAFEVKSNV